MFIFQVCHPIYRRWLREAMLAMVFGVELLNAYDKDPEPFEAAQWVTPGWPWVDPEKDMKAAERAIRDGLSTRSIECAAQGYDATVIDAQQKGDNDRADKLGLSYDSDGRKMLTGRNAGIDGGRNREGRAGRQGGGPVTHLTHVASRFINCPLMIHPPKLEVIIKAIGPRLGIDPDAIWAPRVPMDATATLMARYMEAGDERDYAVMDGIAVIPVQGMLLKKESFMSAWSGCSSYEQIQRQIAGAVDDGGVRAILLDIDSPGGETAGCFDLADYIYSIRGIKPVYAVANDIALSAAYAIASSASQVFLNRTGAVGSVGVYALHVDQSGFDKELGAKYTYVFAGERKVDGNPHQPLSERARADIQDEVDREYGIFTETVARNRKAGTKDIVATQAAVVWADNALPLLADQVGMFDDAMNALRQLMGGASVTYKAAGAATLTKGESAMAQIEPEAAAAKKDGESEEKKTKKKPDPVDAKPPARMTTRTTT